MEREIGSRNVHSAACWRAVHMAISDDNNLEVLVKYYLLIDHQMGQQILAVRLGYQPGTKIRLLPEQTSTIRSGTSL